MQNLYKLEGKLTILCNFFYKLIGSKTAVVEGFIVLSPLILVLVHNKISTINIFLLISYELRVGFCWKRNNLFCDELDKFKIIDPMEGSKRYGRNFSFHGGMKDSIKSQIKKIWPPYSKSRPLLKN